MAGQRGPSTQSGNGVKTAAVILVIIVIIAWVAHAHGSTNTSSTTTGGSTAQGQCDSCGSTLTGTFNNTAFGPIQIQLTPIIPPTSLNLNPANWVQLSVTVGSFTFSTNDPFFKCLEGVTPYIFKSESDLSDLFLVFFKDCLPQQSSYTSGGIGAMRVGLPVDNGGIAYFRFPNDNSLCSTSSSGDVECMPNYCLSVDQTSLNLDNNTSSQTVTLTNCGSGDGNDWQGNVSTSDGSDWLSIDPSSGTIESGASQQITISVNGSNLSSGSYSGQVTFTTTNCHAQTSINVTLNI